MGDAVGRDCVCRELIWMTWDLTGERDTSASGTAAPSVAVPGSAGPAAAPGADANTQQLLGALMTMLKPRSTLAPPVTTHKSAAAPFLNLVPIIGPALSSAAKQMNEKKIAEAEGDWSDLSMSIQQYIGPDGKINPAAYTDPKVQSALDPKKVKKMAKALNLDWLD